MKPSEVARKLGVSKNTVINWGHWYEECLSPAPPEGEDRIFIDEDLRVLAFIHTLSSRGLNRVGVLDALKQKTDSGAAFPNEKVSEESEMSLALREAQTQLALKDAEIGEIGARLEELRTQLTEERAEASKRYEALFERYLADLARLNHEKGALEAQLKNKERE
jgi:DNA-binding transcriptional MerR regulator